MDWPADRVERRKTDTLVPYARNARTHSDAQVAQIAASVREWGWTVPVLVDEEGTIIAGHGRVLAAQSLGLDEVPVMVATGWTEAQRRAYVLADNRLALNAGWDTELLKLELADLKAADFDMELMGFGEDELAGMMADAQAPDAAAGGSEAGSKGSLADRFGAVPFSVLNAREGWWQERKNWWLGLGIKSEEGRGDNLLKMSDTAIEPDPVKRAAMQAARAQASIGGVLMDSWTSHPEFYPQKQAKERELGRTLTTAEFQADHWVPPTDGAYASGTSIFDPVLTELAYRWFSPPGGVILDPFAGGSVRGIVASRLGRQYIGHELREEQVEANRVQGDTICGENDLMPAWICGDSRIIDQTCADVDADFVFSCPPYADLEVYSDDPADLSTLGYAEFVKAYREIIAKTCARLRNDRFACFVVGDVRAPDGSYRNFVGDTVSAFQDAGLKLYNEAILITAVGSLAIRVGRQFTIGRKLGKTHQNVLVFIKGDWRKAVEACGVVEVHVPDEGEDVSDLGEVVAL